MKLFYKIKTIAIILIVLLIDQTAIAQYFWQVGSIQSLSGGNSYCLNEVPNPLVLALGQCAGGIMQPHNSTHYRITWYVNTINSTEGGTLLNSSYVSTPHSFPASRNYTPDTSVEGVFYYYAVLTDPSLTTCGFTDTLVSQTEEVIVTRSTGVDIRTEIDSYTWLDGVTYTESNNTASFNIENGASNGCDSLVNLNLTILKTCNLSDARNNFEWIQQVVIGNEIDNSSGKNTPAFSEFSESILLVEPQEIVTVSLTPGYKKREYKEYWRIWIDWNNDGHFNDSDEKVFEQNGKGTQTGSFQVPNNTSFDNLKMRVSMHWKRYADCHNFINGEIEDYIIKVNSIE